MKKIDLHVHSCYSNHSSLSIVKELDAKESYTHPDTVYELAKKAGMDFVTITDHNTIEGILLLQKKHPEDVVMGCELSCYFPDDNCEIHVLVFGFTEDQFKDMNLLRFDIYSLRSYLIRNKIPYSVAHATFPVNGKLTFYRLEELLLMFSVFETINGCRSKLHNETWAKTLNNLTPLKMKELQEKYVIDTLLEDSWKKGFTGGSDDHAGLFVGKTYTEALCNTKEEFLQAILLGKTNSNGRNNEFISMAFSFYKIVFEYLKRKKPGIHKSLFGILSESVFTPKSVKLQHRLKLVLARLVSSKKYKKIKPFFRLLDKINRKKLSPDERFLEIYQQIGYTMDSLVKDFVTGLTKNLFSADISSLVKDFLQMVPGILVGLPFLFTSQQLHVRHDLIQDLKANFLTNEKKTYQKKILWFTDTINDLNGVSATLCELGWQADRHEFPLTIVASLDKNNSEENLPPNILNLESIYQFNLPYYESYLLKVPSLLSSLKKIYDESPDEIIISTPGPIGLIGYMIAKIMHIKCSGVYHTDFVLQAKQIVSQDVTINLLEKYVRWFYGNMDEIRVTTKEYADILENRGIPRSKLRFLPKGIDPELFFPIQPVVIPKNTIQNHVFQMVYAGRISKDKNLDFLISVFERVHQRNLNTRLIMVGEGPYLDELIKKYEYLPSLNFCGRVPRRQLPEIYSSSDVFLFPSTTDTFGMAVLEAQACGLPVLVTDQGGPQELIKNGCTGFVLQADHQEQWIEHIEKLIQLSSQQPQEYKNWRIESRTNAIKDREWKSVLASL